MKSDFFLKVLHEEPLDRVSLEAIKGGQTICMCFGGATFSCTCYDTESAALICVCYGNAKLTCTAVGMKPACPSDNLAT